MAILAVLQSFKMFGEVKDKWSWSRWLMPIRTHTKNNVFGPWVLALFFYAAHERLWYQEFLIRFQKPADARSMHACMKMRILSFKEQRAVSATDDGLRERLHREPYDNFIYKYFILMTSAWNKEVFYLVKKILMTFGLNSLQFEDSSHLAWLGEYSSGIDSSPVWPWTTEQSGFRRCTAQLIVQYLHTSEQTMQLFTKYKRLLMNVKCIKSNPIFDIEGFLSFSFSSVDIFPLFFQRHFSAYTEKQNTFFYENAVNVSENECLSRNGFQSSSLKCKSLSLVLY